MNGSTRSKFEPIPNPYIVGNPIRDPRMFFGREDDFVYVKKKFSGPKEGGIIVLCGARRSGKTSILFQILGGRLGDDFLPVLIDMQSMAINSDHDFLTKLAREIVAAIDHPGITLDTQEPKWADNPFTAFEDLVKNINLTMNGKKLVFMFDEYELFETNIESGTISTQILNLLANLIEHKRVFAVFTGSDNLEARAKPYWGVFLSKALHRRISFLSHGDTLRLVLQPVEGMVRYGEGIPDSIFTLTAGQPFYTQVLCQSLIDHLNDRRRSDVEPEDVQQAVDEIIENPLPQMIFSWNALTDLEKISLSIIAELTREQSRFVTPRDIVTYAEHENIGYALDINELNKSLESLFHHDVLEKEGATDAYRFKMDLWRLWVARMHSVWQVIDEMERAGDVALGRGLLPREIAGRRRRKVTVAAIAVMSVVIPVGIYLLMRGGAGTGDGTVEVATLEVRTNPGGANVFVDRNWIGTSPVEGIQVPVESRLISVEMAGWRTIEDTLVLRTGEVKELVFDLVEVAGQLRVLSEPPGAAVSVDGKSTGLTTPAVVPDLSANTPHRVEISLAGYRAGIFDAVRIHEDSTVTVSHSFAKMEGALSVVSEPPDAEVYLDGELVGTTPCLIDRVAYGHHGLRISKTGYYSHTEDVDVSKPTAKVEVELSRLAPGRIIFNVEPYASLSINGKLVRDDVAYHEVELPPGRYTILLAHPQLGTHTEEVEVRSNESVTIRHRFSE